MNYINKISWVLLLYDEFKNHIKEIADKFKAIDKKETIRLISHLDADGISAASIMIRLLNKDNRKYSISIVQQLTEPIINALSKEAYNYFVFTDLGSGQINLIKKMLGEKKIFILDHHKPEEAEAENIYHVNPHLFGIDGSLEIAGSGVVYLFAKAVNKELENLAHVAVIGAIGDVQEEHGFSKLNSGILEKAIELGKIKVIKGIRVFGAQTRALHKVLEYSTNPYIPGVSGSESGAIQFLQQIGINPKNGNGWTKLVHLSDEDLKKLATGIIMRRLNEDKPEEILGNVYILPNEDKESPTRDAKEFSTLLNSCGRMGKASLGIGTCLGDKKIKAKAIRSMVDYKRELVNALKWYEKNKESENVIQGDGYLIINTKDNIMPTIVGTLASIISKSGNVKQDSFIMSMADLLDGNTKISLRIASYKPKDIDLRNIIKEITDKVGGEAGGHMHAAGAIIPNEKEEEFIKAAKFVLNEKAIEEKIL